MGQNRAEDYRATELDVLELANYFDEHGWEIRYLGQPDHTENGYEYRMMVIRRKENASTHISSR